MKTETDSSGRYVARFNDAEYRLHMAAPELLHWLRESANLLDLAQSIVDDESAADRMRHVLRNAKAAIAKATS